MVFLQEVYLTEMYIPNFNYFANMIDDKDLSVGVLCIQDLIINDLKLHPSGRIQTFKHYNILYFTLTHTVKVGKRT